ncbi:MAG: glycosyltransferase [Planctomycetota bacterium]|nr:glycosyltransferase [Planctomycetota bacterium]MDA0933666.1 glycosyltransferase [Planctomycetota bacterium]
MTLLDGIEVRATPSHSPNRAVRVLHLFANYKWTGPADPAIRCAVWQRRMGAVVRFAQAGFTHPGAEHRMARELSLAGLPVVTGLDLRKHFHVRRTVHDARTLRGILERDPVDVVHAHLPGDHLIAALALRRFGAGRPLLIRSIYDPDAPRRGWRERLAFGETDSVVVPTERCARAVAEAFELGPDRVLYQDPPTESHRSRMQGSLRAEFGVPDDAFLIGITARIQPHRRFEFLWEVAAQVVKRRPRVRFVLLGRGDEEDVEQLVRAPVRELGLGEHVLLPGYLYEPRYSLALRALDAFVFLVPGSDGTCRALREVMALGLPVVATPRGMLPDLLGEHADLDEVGAAGLIRPEKVESWVETLVGLADDGHARERLGAAARARVAGPMDPRAATRRLLQHYRSRLGWSGASAR